jgi:hypothetical protein
MDGHAGSTRMRARIAKSRQGRPTVCSCPLCTRKSAISDSLNGLGTQAAVLVSIGHSVASTNRHRIPAGVEPDAAVLHLLTRVEPGRADRPAGSSAASIVDLQKARASTQQAGSQPGPTPGGSSGGARLIAAHITFLCPGEIPGARAYL